MPLSSVDVYGVLENCIRHSPTHRRHQMDDSLPNSFAELVVVVGMDESSGLTPAKQQVGCQQPGLFETLYAPQLIAVISSQVALAPQQATWRDEHFPPMSRANRDHNWSGGSRSTTTKINYYKWRRRLQSGYSSSQQRSRSGGQEMRVARSLARRWTFTPADLVSQHEEDIRKLKAKLVDLPVGFDLLFSLTTLCFPDGAYVYSAHREERVHYLVLTDMAGDHTYATCVTCYRPASAHRQLDSEETSSWRLSAARDADFDVCYVPLCYVIISRFPYFTKMKDCISRLLRELKVEGDRGGQLVKSFALQLCITPVPPPGKLAIQFRLLDTLFTLRPASRPGRPLVDMPMNALFESFSVDAIACLITCVLTQQRVIFISENYALLTIISQSIMQCLAPLRWNLIYVPVLPEAILELLEAPGSYVLGCHSRHAARVCQLEGVVVADIDHGRLHICDSIFVPEMPHAAFQVFKESCDALQCHLDLDALQRLSTFCYEETRAAETTRRDAFNTSVLLISLQLMVNLFSGVLPHIKVERRFFNRDQFLDNVPEADKPFYQQALVTDMFSTFLKQRLAQKQDCWTLLEEQLRNHLPIKATDSASNLCKDWSSLVEVNKSKAHPVLHKSLSRLSMQTLFSEPTQIYMLRLPKFIYGIGHNFYESCLHEITRHLKACQSSHHRASLLYLRGMLHSVVGKKMESVEDFHNLGACDKRLFPTLHVVRIVASMSSLERETLKNSAFYTRSEVWLDALDTKSCDQPVVVKLEKLPMDDIDLPNFTQLVRVLEIAMETGTIKRLFDVLVKSEKKVLPPAVFEEFYRCWRNVNLTMQAHFSTNRMPLDADETVLKLSEVIRCDLGTGRLGLTQKRLFHLMDRTNRYQEVMTIAQIDNLEKVQQKQFFYTVDTLHIHSAQRFPTRPFVACLREARDFWYEIVDEMRAGCELTSALCEPSILLDAAHNVQLVDAVTQCSSAGDFVLHDDASVGHTVALLCHFTRRRDAGEYALSEETKQILEYRLDPNYGQAERVTVEVLLYTAASVQGEGGCGPMLWCGMADGKVRVFDTRTNTLDCVYLQPKDRVVCLIAVGEDHVWAGSFDTCIYVIDKVTRSCNQALVQHTDMVSDMTLTDSNSVVSASVNGQIIEWDVRTLQSRRQLALPGVDSLRSVRYSRQHLWCCTRDELFVLSLGGDLLYRMENVPGRPGCFELTDDEVWVGAANEGAVYILQRSSRQLTHTLTLGCRGVSKMAVVCGKVWVGSKDGVIYIYDLGTRDLQRRVKGHDDSIRALCVADVRFVVTGAGSGDGKVAVWRV